MTTPRVSVIIPTYESHATLGACLAALARQTGVDGEVIVIDSSPVDRSTPIVQACLPAARALHSATRLLPHAARNWGAKVARGELLVFTDPDIYPAPDWLSHLVQAHETTGQVITGPICCYGRRWFDRGVHLTKFAKFMPGGPPRPTNLAPTGNMLCPRAVYEALGGLREDVWGSDSIFSVRLREQGYGIWYAPQACVWHDHRTTWRGFVRERYARGRDAGGLHAEGYLGEPRWSAARLLFWALASLAPLRLLTGGVRIAAKAQRAHMLGEFLRTWPIILVGQGSLLWGEGTLYLEHLVRRGSREADRRP